LGALETAYPRLASGKLERIDEAAANVNRIEQRGRYE
jgi:hypothetical protein